MFNPFIFFSDQNLGDEGPPLVVVAGDVTLNSLKVFVEDAMPLCSNLNCLIIDDRGNLLYEKMLDNFDGVPKFLGNANIMKALLVNNASSTLVTKKQCLNLFNANLRLKRFQSVSIKWIIMKCFFAYA